MGFEKQESRNYPARFYTGAPDEILWHYCDQHAFYEICTGKKLRFSDLRGMNDFLELAWGHDLWRNAVKATEIAVGSELLNAIYAEVLGSRIHGLITACCLSTDGDVLSQWRAYADDGSGFAIGFDSESLVQLPCRPLKVEYDETIQLNEVMSFIYAIKSVEDEQETKYSEDFVRVCREFAFDLSAYKNPAFVEEKEVRLTHVLINEKSGGNFKLADPGGTDANDHHVDGVQVQFRMRNSRPIPFIDVDFSKVGAGKAIRKIAFGPRNPSDELAVSLFLETVGLHEVELVSSKASYR